MRSSLIFALTASLPLLAQSGTKIMSGSVSKDGIALYYETRLEPPWPPLAAGINGGTYGMHRYMMDSVRRKYFGYDIDIERLPQVNTYRLTLGPLSIGRDRIAARDWTVLPAPAYPPPQTVHGGDTIALDLFVHPATGQKIVDYIRIKSSLREVQGAAGEARDFSLDDVEIRLMEPYVSVNGKAVPATVNFSGAVSGAAIWFYIPDLGRYFVSLVPHPELGFQKAGEIRGSSLSIQSGSGTIVLDCNGRIAPGNAAYNLYVLHQAGWRPHDDRARNAFLMTGGSSLQKLLGR